MKKTFKILLIITTLSGLLTACSKESEDTAVSESSVQTTSTLTLSGSTSLEISASSQIYASGGTTPYKYFVGTGDISINSTTGYFLAPSYETAIQLGVEDADGSVAYLIISIVDSDDDSSDSTSTLALYPLSTTMGLSESLTLTAVGGVAPYGYYIVSGRGTLADSLFTASSREGEVQIRVVDAEGNTADSWIEVVDWDDYDDDTETSDTEEDTDVKNPVWAPSAAGGYYDTTGQLTGSYRLPQMRIYGGTFYDTGLAVPTSTILVNDSHGHACQAPYVVDALQLYYCQTIVPTHYE